jgi:hypothetical protein
VLEVLIFASPSKTTKAPYQGAFFMTITPQPSDGSVDFGPAFSVDTLMSFSGVLLIPINRT